MNQDSRVPSSLQGRPGSYNQDNFNQVEQERPVRDRPLNNKNFLNSNLTGKNQDLNFANRKQIDLDEADDTFTNQEELSNILARGERLKKQMADALNPSNAWEQIHGIYNVPKTYVPPFLKDEHDEMMQDSPEKIRDKVYDLEVENQAQNPNEESLIKINPRKAPLP
jgi:hypothetical protein